MSVFFALEDSKPCGTSCRLRAPMRVTWGLASMVAAQSRFF